VRDRAVASFMSPHHVNPMGVGGDTTDLAASARRVALLDAVAASDADLLDQLHSAQEDYKAELQAADAARAKAQQRKRDTESSLAALEKARGNSRRAAAAVTARQRAVLSEIDDQSKAESELNRIIAQRSRQAGGAGTSARNATGCIWPVAGSVTSEYGNRWGRLHAGIDIAAPTGTPIWAAKSGDVIFAGQQSGYGNVIIIDHGDGFSTVYAHQSRLVASDGQSVSQGQTIGYVGTTGHSTGPHVHFETRYGGTPRNPRGCLP
jgi:murein DD-endopeptidase MepM/ murein hydrolase activator NlpD